MWSGAHILLFSLFLIFVVILPSIYFWSLLDKKSESLLEHIVLGYHPTVVLIFVLTWLGTAIKMPAILYLLLLFSFLGLRTLWGKRKLFWSQKPESSFYKVLIASVYLVLLVLMYVTHSTKIVLPDKGVTEVFQDSLWNIGNTWSMIRGNFPVIDSRFSGHEMGYHFIQSYYHAAVYFFTKIHPYYVQGFLSPVFDLFIIVSSTVIGLRKFLGLKKHTVGYVLLGVFFASGVTAYTVYNFQLAIFTSPLTFFFGFSSIFLFLCFMFAYFSKSEKLQVVYPSILFCFMVASKASMVFVTLPTLFILHIFNYGKNADKQKIKNEIIFGIVLCTVCVLLKFMIFSGSKPEMVLFPDNPGSRVYNFLSQHFAFLPHLLINIIFYSYIFVQRTVFVFLNWYSIVLALTWLWHKDFRAKLEQNKQPPRFILIFALIASAWACIIGYEQNSNSGAEVYYYWFAFMAMFILASVAIEYILGHQLRKAKVALNLLFVANILIFANSLFENRYFNFMSNSEYAALSDPRNTINRDEVEAMFWINSSIESDSVFVTDRRITYTKPSGDDRMRFFYYSALSGKQFYAEGEGFTFGAEYLEATKRWETIDIFLKSENPIEQLNALSKMPVHYFIQSLRFNKRDFSNLEKLSLVYENPSIRVYKLL